MNVIHQTLVFFFFFDDYAFDTSDRILFVRETKIIERVHRFQS